MKIFEYIQIKRPYYCGECENGSNVIDELNRLGSEGWELVSHTIHWNITTNVTQCWILKREK